LLKKKGKVVTAKFRNFQKDYTSQHAGYFTIDNIELVSDITEHSAGEYNWYTGI